MSKQKAERIKLPFLASFVLALIFLSVLILFYPKKNVLPPAEPPREIPDLNEVVSLYPVAEEFFGVLKKTNPEINISGFKKYKGVITTDDYNSFGVTDPGKIKNDVRWNFSPDGVMAASVYGQYQQPDSSLEIYNRFNNNKIERLQFCGTPCRYWGVIWLNGSRLMFFNDIEAYNEPANNKFKLIVHLYDFQENTDTAYTSNEVSDIKIPPWPDWEKQEKSVYEMFYGKKN